MNAGRPVAPSGVIFTLAWFAIVAVTIASLLYAAARRQSFLGKLLYLVGGLCLLSVAAAFALHLAIPAWYGGWPDPNASTAEHFFVSSKGVLYPVSEAEFHSLERMRRHENWLLIPAVVGVACFGLARLLRPRSPRGRPEAT